MGAEGIRVDSLDDFSKALDKAIENEVTTIIDIPISPKENVFPMVPPGKGLKNTIWR